MNNRDSEMEIVRRHIAKAPINIWDLINDLGIRYREREMGHGEDGRIDYDGEGYTITVNSRQSRQRRKFTAAHELAHYLLHRDLIHESGHLDRLFDVPDSANPSAPLRPYHEIEANKLAAQLLMPREAVRNELIWQNYDLASLADAFGVSQEAMTIRLKVLGIDLETERNRHQTHTTDDIGEEPLPF